MIVASINPLDWVTTAAGAVASSATSGFFNALGDWFDTGLQWASQQVAGQLADLAAPNVGSAAFQQLAGTLKWLALATAVATIIGSTGGALVSRRAELADVAREIPVTLLLLACWYGLVTLWFEITRALTTTFTGDSLFAALHGGFTLDAGIPGFPRLLVVLFMQVFLLVFLIEMAALQHILAIATILGPVSLGLRPWPALRQVSTKMIANLAAVSLTPAIAAASMSLAVGDLAGPVGVKQALGALAGMTVTVLMPYLVHRFLPLGGSTDAGGRALIGAAAAAAGGIAAIAATGGAAAPMVAAQAAGQGASRLASLNEGGGQ